MSTHPGGRGRFATSVAGLALPSGVLVWCVLAAACGGDAQSGLKQQDGGGIAPLPDGLAEDAAETREDATEDTVRPDVGGLPEGSPCEGAAECTSGSCRGGFCCPQAADDGATCCADDADCAGLDGPGVCDDPASCSGRVVVGRCEGFVCVAREQVSSSGCAGAVCQAGACLAGDGGSVYEGPGLCDPAGTCVATGARPCDDGDPCTIDGCGAEGCVATPHTGASEVACYSFAAETRGVGRCQDGVASCEAGGVGGCVGDIGPADEACNGLDDDCDGRTDEDTEPECFPYLCAGAAGCATRCDEDAECAAGNFCQGGRCVGAGQDGASCASDLQCASGHCSQGVCCSGGVCCVSNTQCAGLASLSCELTAPSGCQGVRLEGVCNQFKCEAVAHGAPAECAGEVCAPARCEGATLIGPAQCGATGLCLTTTRTACAPYACEAGACKTECRVSSDCSAGSCVEGRCTGLPDGEACSSHGQCAGQRCDNGFCCASGTCCGDDAACAGLTRPATCDSAASCGGSQVVGVCGAGFACKTETRAAPGACEGETCGAAACVNLSGSGVVQEGVQRKLCDAGGQCATVVKDCRDFDDTAFCTSNSSVYAACSGCSPRRSTCVVFDNPCFCE